MKNPFRSLIPPPSSNGLLTSSTSSIMSSVPSQSKTIPLVVLAASAASKSRCSTEIFKPSALKKPRPNNYSRQASAPPSTSSTASVTCTTGSNTSSRRNSGENGNGFRKTREKSPCVSFDSDVKVMPFPENTPNTGSSTMRVRSRSDASSRFKGKIAWLRDRRSQIAEDQSSVGGNATASASQSGSQLAGIKPHRPRTRSDSKWIKIMRKRSASGNPTAEHEEKSFEWPRFLKNVVKKDTNPTANNSSNDQELQRSQSVAGLTNHEVDKVSSKLKRRGSERASTKKSVAFEGSGNSWWSSSMKLLFDKGSKNSRSKPRRRHLSSDARKQLLHLLNFETIFNLKLLKKLLVLVA